MYRLADPLYLLLLILPLGLLILHYWSHKRGRSSLLYSGGHLLANLPRGWRSIVAPHLHWLRYIGLVLLAIALARPQTGNNIEEIETFGVDIMLVLDVSGTMEVRDMKPKEGMKPSQPRRTSFFRPLEEGISRLDTAKYVMQGFIDGRESDRIGLIAFGTQSLTRCPLTVDYDLVRLALSEITIDLFPKEMRATAIGNALATGVSRLYKSDAKSKIIILLTDGANNSGNITPLAAADIAKSEGIRVYTIGFGSPGQTDVDEESLRQIAENTGGRFFRSKSLEQLQEVYDLIDKLEKSEVVVKNYEVWNEWFQWFLWAGCASLLLEVIMSQIICRRVP